MADKVSIAIRQEKAINRLNATAAQLAEVVGVDAPTIRTRAHDRELLRAEQLEALAGWVERLADVFAAPKQTEVPAEAEPPVEEQTDTVEADAVEPTEEAPAAKAKTKKAR